jgi:hypothetical protein
MTEGHYPGSSPDPRDAQIAQEVLEANPRRQESNRRDGDHPVPAHKGDGTKEDARDFADWLDLNR